MHWTYWVAETHLPLVAPDNTTFYPIHSSHTHHVLYLMLLTFGMVGTSVSTGCKVLSREVFILSLPTSKSTPVFSSSLRQTDRQTDTHTHTHTPMASLLFYSIILSTITCYHHSSLPLLLVFLPINHSNNGRFFKCQFAEEVQCLLRVFAKSLQVTWDALHKRQDLLPQHPRILNKCPPMATSK